MHLRHFRPLSLAALGLFFLSSGAQTYAFTPVPSVHGGGGARATGALVLADTEFEAENTDVDIEGQILTLAYKTPIGPQLAIGGGFGFMIDGEYQPRAGSLDDGSGYRLFFDADYEIKRFSTGQLVGSFSFLRDDLKFEAPQDRELEFTINEAKIGGLFIHRIQEVAIYGGLEIFLYSDGEIELVNRGDVERNDRLNLRIGGAFSIDQSFDLRADLYLMSEETLTLAVDFRI